MKPTVHNSGGLFPRWVGHARASAAFTLTEMLVACGLFVLVVTSILACHLAGLEFNEFVRPKVENSRYARETLAKMIEEIRCATSIDIGTGSVSSFIVAGSTNAQMGNAIKIYPGTNNSQYI